MSRRSLDAVVLAAGEGTRMRSVTPKVLHPVCGRPMLLHVLDAVATLSVGRIVVVVGGNAEAVAEAVRGEPSGVTVELVEQSPPRGTGDACSVALAAFAGDPDDDRDLIVVPGDTPLLRGSTLATLVDRHVGAGVAATLLTAEVADATGYGRVLRDGTGRVDRIVEHADASPEERAGREINTSIYCFRRSLLAPALERVTPDNAQGEHYLTDVIAVLRGDGHGIEAVVGDTAETAGVNDRVQLASAEATLRTRINQDWMRAGVTMTDPTATYVEAGVVLSPDVVLLPGVMLEGRTSVGTGSVLGPNVRLRNTVVGERATIHQTVARDTEIGDDVTVGPFVHLRPGTRLAAGVHVGEFVGMKNADVREGAKVPHLAYVGDAEVGERANIGAGTITANYDGRHKHRTVIGPDARIGSNTVLVAPVEVGEGAYTGAGAVVNHDVPPGALARGVPAVNVDGWVAARADRDPSDVVTEVAAEATTEGAEDAPPAPD